MIVLCSERSPVGWEVRLSATSCLFSLGFTGRWVQGEQTTCFVVFIGSGRLYFTQILKIIGDQFPFLFWVRFVITSLCFETVCDAVWLFLGVLSFFFHFCFLNVVVIGLSVLPYT